MYLAKVLPFVHQLLRTSLNEGDIAVDATAGNGNDTVLLAQCVGETGKVYAFDVQDAAIVATSKRLQQEKLAERVQLIQAGHQQMLDFVPPNIAAAVFNFGYLPRGDKNITTLPETSIVAMSAALTLLKSNGLLLAVVYHGHDMGKREAQDLVQYAQSLPQEKFRVLRYEFINQKNCPPFVLAIEKY